MRTALRMLAAAAAISMFSLASLGAHADTGTGTVSGRVTYTDGRPVGRYPVEYRPAANIAAFNTVRTDAKGNYLISNLPNGVYFVGFFHPDRVPPARNPQLEDLPDVSPEWAQIGIPRTRRVVIANGAPVSGIDFVITDIGPETVEGPSTDGETLMFPDSGKPGDDGPGGSALGTLVLGVLGAGALAIAAARGVRKRSTKS